MSRQGSRRRAGWMGGTSPICARVLHRCPRREHERKMLARTLPGQGRGHLALQACSSPEPGLDAECAAPRGEGRRGGRSWDRSRAPPPATSRLSGPARRVQRQPLPPPGAPGPAPRPLATLARTERRDAEAATRVLAQRGAATHLRGAPGGRWARRAGAAAGGAPGPAHPGQPRHAEAAAAAGRALSWLPPAAPSTRCLLPPSGSLLLPGLQSPPSTRSRPPSSFLPPLLPLSFLRGAPRQAPVGAGEGLHVEDGPGKSGEAADGRRRPRRDQREALSRKDPAVRL